MYIYKEIIYFDDLVQGYGISVAHQVLDFLGLKVSELPPWLLALPSINDVPANDQWPLLLTWFNFNPSMDK